MTESKTDQDLHQELSSLHHFTELGLLVAQGLEPREMGNLVVTSLTHLLEAPFVAIGLLEEEDLSWFVIGQWKQNSLDTPIAQEVTSLLADNLSNRAFASAGSLLLGDFSPAIHIVPEPLSKLGIKSLLVTPIRTVAHTFGVILLGKEIATVFTQDRRFLSSTIANQMAIALENMRLHKQLSQAEAHYRDLIENAQDLILTLDLEGHITSVNRVLLEYGCDKGEVIGKNVFDLIPKEYQQQLYGDFESLSQGKPVKGELKIESKQRQGYIAFEYRNNPIVKDNKITSVQAIVRDVTERENAEEREKELQKKLNISSRLAAIGELAAGVAHEINNPLTGIQGYSERLLRKSTDEKVKRDLERIHKESLRAAKIVQNLLTFARHLESKKEPLDVNDIVREALELRAYELRTSGIEVITKLAPDLASVMADFQQIQEVLLNIIMNAEQAMREESGERKFIIKTKQMKGRIIISCTDNGPGIPPEYLSRVFDPFFTMKASKGGTGLGLSVCHGIVADHGGSIYTKSKVGEGATFFVELPVYPKGT